MRNGVVQNRMEKGCPVLCLLTFFESIYIHVHVC